MQCPIDGAELVMTERSGVEIDYCPKCRGVWLDRGELDKIIDRAADPPRRRARPRAEHAVAPEDYNGRAAGLTGRSARASWATSSTSDVRAWPTRARVC